MRKITPDELGEKGESRFKELCADVGLICNKSDRDRAGWDFIVESSFDDSAPLSLDRRNAPLSCHVQLKTILSTTKSISLKLNMAERLAKEIKPSFICVFKVDEKLEFSDAFLIHISEDRLSAILKRLRKEGAKAKKKLSKQSISFTPLDSERLMVSGDALLIALKASCGNDMGEYSKAKQKQLKNLGYEERRFSANMRIAVPDKAQLMDIFFGTKKEISVSDFKATETRFGISLPEFEHPNAKLTIQPQAIDKCTIKVRSDEFASPAIFEGEVYLSPSILLPMQRMRIESEMFSIQFDRDEGGELRTTFHSSTNSKICTSGSWLNYWRMLLALQKNSGAIEICPHNLSNPSFGLNILVNGLVGSVENLTIEPYITLCEWLSIVIQRAGVSPEPLFSFEEILVAQNLIGVLMAIINGVCPSIDFLKLEENNDSVIPLERFILADRTKISTFSIAWYVTAKIEICNNSAYFSEFNLKMLRTIDDQPKSFESFAEKAMSHEGLDCIMYCNLNSNMKLNGIEINENQITDPLRRE